MSEMDDAKLKLGALRSPLRKAISVVHLRGFFYWRRHKGLWHKRLLNLRVNENAELPARQHLISYILHGRLNGISKDS